MSGMTEIELVGATKRFGRDVALDAVSLSVAEGETLALFGPSGSGKTVLLRLIAGVIEPDAGSVRIGGRDMAGAPPEDRGVGMAFQNFALFPHLSAFDNIASPLEANRLDASKVRQGVEAVARLLKIDHVLGHAPKALSNGQKQRTALARALAGKPKVLLLDDPLRNVDAKLRFEMRLELPRLLAEERAATIYVTQDFREAMALGDRIAVLEAGRIVQIGTPEQIYFEPATLGIAQLFGDPTINLLDVTPEMDGAGPFARLSDMRAPLDPGLGHAVGTECVLGLRPEALHFVGADAPGRSR
jgi:multiple sugar transport system ATP-binding protein